MVAIKQHKLTIADYLSIFRRRKWWIVLVCAMAMAIAAVYSYVTPPLYRSSTLILVEPQRIPTNYVSPTVTSSVQERLNTIKQVIMSRTNLEKIIEQLGLLDKGAKPYHRRRLLRT
jgi:uncharacterized protein involved in exopolysaccharide biosynthesis